MPRVTLTKSERKRGVDLRDVINVLPIAGRAMPARVEKKPRKLRTTEAIDALLDEIKDEIDRLDTVHKRLRAEAANELIRYICLHNDLPSYV